MYKGLFNIAYTHSMILHYFFPREEFLIQST